MSHDECDAEFYNLSPSTPRVASGIEDLRVGQVLAHRSRHGDWIVYRMTERIVPGNWGNTQWDGDVVILSEPDPEPVIASREAFDRLAATLTDPRWLPSLIADAARALVDEVRAAE